MILQVDARRLKLSAGGLSDALANVASQPLLWAGLAGLWLSASGRALPLMVNSYSLLHLCYVGSVGQIMRRGEPREAGLCSDESCLQEVLGLGPRAHTAARSCGDNHMLGLPSGYSDK